MVRGEVKNDAKNAVIASALLRWGLAGIGRHYGVYREISAEVQSIALIQPVAPKRSPGPPVVTVARAAPKMSDAARGSSAMRSAGCMCAASTPAIGNRGAVHEHRRRWLSQYMRFRATVARAERVRRRDLNAIRRRTSKSPAPECDWIHARSRIERRVRRHSRDCSVIAARLRRGSGVSFAHGEGCRMLHLGFRTGSRCFSNH